MRLRRGSALLRHKPAPRLLSLQALVNSNRRSSLFSTRILMQREDILYSERMTKVVSRCRGRRIARYVTCHATTRRCELLLGFQRPTQEVYCLSRS
jgi:hypothetical protein